MDQYNAYHKFIITDKAMSIQDTINSHASNSQSKEQAS